MKKAEVTAKHHRIRLPRALLLWWSLWLLASWHLSYGWTVPIGPTLRTYISATQRLMFIVMLGISIIWPLFRLTKRDVQVSRLLSVLDWITLFAAMQILLWPLRLPTEWSAAQVIMIDLTIWCWGLLIAAVIAAGTMSPGRRWRMPAMLGCLVLALGAPVIMFISQPGASFESAELYHWSPITGIWLLVGRSSTIIVPAEWMRIAILGTAAALAWIGVMLFPRKHTSAALRDGGSAGVIASPA